MISVKNKIIFFILLFVLFFIVISLVYILLNNKDSRTTIDSSETIIYVDPGSGETIIVTPDKIPETSTGKDILALGFNRLIDRGMTKSQVDKLKSYFLDYSNMLKNPIGEVSISVDTIGKLVDNGVVDITFDITIDRDQLLAAKVKYTGFDDPRMSLYKSNKIIYSSR